MTNSSIAALKWLQLDKDEKPDNFYSCLGAVIASTLFALHLNIPALPDEPIPHQSNSLNELWRSSIVSSFRMQLLWAIMVIIAPELLLSVAFGDWRAARHGRDIVKRFGRGSVQNWSQLQIHFANMGGVRVEVARARDSEGRVMTRSEESAAAVMYEFAHHMIQKQLPINRALGRVRLWGEILKRRSIGTFRKISSLNWLKLAKLQGLVNRQEGNTDGNNIEMEPVRNLDLTETSMNQTSSTLGLDNSMDIAEVDLTDPIITDNDAGPSQTMLTTASDEELPDETSTRIVLYLNSFQVAAAQSLGIIDDLQDLTNSSIQERSKSTSILKIAALIPLLWFALRLILKKATSRHISQLELASATYVLCATISYIMYWSKPQGIERPVDIKIPLSSTTRPITDDDLNFLRWLGGSPFLVRNFVPPFGMDGKLVDPTEPIPTGTSLTTFLVWGGKGNDGVSLFDDDFAGIMAGLLFGALYLLQWDSAAIASRVELVIWRIAALAVIGSLIPYAIANGLCTMAYSGLLKNGKVHTHVLHSIVLYVLLGIYGFGRIFMLSVMLQDFFA